MSGEAVDEHDKPACLMPVHVFFNVVPLEDPECLCLGYPLGKFPYVGWMDACGLLCCLRSKRRNLFPDVLKDRRNLHLLAVREFHLEYPLNGRVYAVQFHGLVGAVHCPRRLNRLAGLLVPEVVYEFLCIRLEVLPCKELPCVLPHEEWKVCMHLDVVLLVEFLVYEQVHDGGGKV